MKKPSIVFDIRSPPYVDTSLDVISQVFIDSVSVEAHKLSKDSPTHKLIFTSEMSQYREKVKQFYKEISVGESQPEVLREYLTEVNQVIIINPFIPEFLKLTLPSLNLVSTLFHIRISVAVQNQNRMANM